MAVPPLIEVVEDDVDVRRTLVRVIESFGYRVRCHENALAYLAAEPMEDAAAMVLDVRMPGMNGIELKIQLEHMGRHTPAIFISGGTHSPLLDSPQVRNAVAFLWKPFRLEQLEEALERAVATAQG